MKTHTVKRNCWVSFNRLPDSREHAVTNTTHTSRCLCVIILTQSAHTAVVGLLSDLCSTSNSYSYGYSLHFSPGLYTYLILKRTRKNSVGTNIDAKTLKINWNRKCFTAIMESYKFRWNKHANEMERQTFIYWISQSQQVMFFHFWIHQFGKPG